VAKVSLRQQFREDPRTIAASVSGAVAVYVAVGLVRPRWLTLGARRTPRQWLWSIALRLVAMATYLVWIQPRMERLMERNERAHAELKEELGRDPSPREQMARMEQVEADRS